MSPVLDELRRYAAPGESLTDAAVRLACVSALNETGGYVPDAARLLGVQPKTLYWRLALIRGKGYPVPEWEYPA